MRSTHKSAAHPLFFYHIAKHFSIRLQHSCISYSLSLQLTIYLCNKHLMKYA